VLGDLPEIVARSGVELDALEFHERREWALAANWKLGIENYLECYHCPVAHLGFSALIDVGVDVYRYSASRWTSSQTGAVRPSALTGNGKAVAYDPHREVTEAQYHVIWPNCTINIDPGRANLSAARPGPRTASCARRCALVPAGEIAGSVYQSAGSV
jgi:choline monooxygenase